MNAEEEHPVVDKVFERLERGSRVGAEIFVRAARAGKYALARTVKLIEGTTEYLERRAAELDREDARGAVAAPHSPQEGDDGVLRDPEFDFLNRPLD